ncbi:hypothetical protein BRC61_01365 [Halobacteriales archaeon QH_10_65_19]|nr:MAG: hypothetical protein BRC61_01365 [Halobacteriales archaeon QH_10_65_19]
MVEADPVMRAARNGFLVLIVVLLGLSVYQFIYVDDGGLTIPAVWAVGAGVYYASKYYYQRRDTAAGSGEDGGDEADPTASTE